MIYALAQMACVLSALATLQSLCMMAEHPEMWGVSLVLTVWFAMLTRRLYQWIERRDRVRRMTRLQVLRAAQQQRKEQKSA